MTTETPLDAQPQKARRQNPPRLPCPNRERRSAILRVRESPYWIEWARERCLTGDDWHVSEQGRDFPASVSQQRESLVCRPSGKLIEKHHFFQHHRLKNNNNKYNIWNKYSFWKKIYDFPFSFLAPLCQERHSLSCLTPDVVTVAMANL